MKCAYCNNEAKGTKEHIISCGILDLFPECNITYDTKRGVVHEADPMIKDVCSSCNSRLSYLDSYIIDLINKYALIEYTSEDKIQFEYDYTKLQKTLLKFAYNDMRSYKEDCSYFDKDLIDYILDENCIDPKAYISVFAGLAVNTSPLPTAFTGNIKLQWNRDPVFLDSSLIKHIDYDTGYFTLEKDIVIKKFDDYVFSYIFRFNSIQFILVCWTKDSIITDTNNKLFCIYYPYTLLEESGKSELSICTNEVNFHKITLITLNWDQITELETMSSLCNKSMYSFKNEYDKLWKQQETLIAKNNPRERTRRKRKSN